MEITVLWGTPALALAVDKKKPYTVNPINGQKTKESSEPQRSGFKSNVSDV